jgi:hypothetical protein
MEINAYYQIGKDHKVCEDYALCGTEPFPYAILSDGCSSVNDSDIGSRILVSMAKKNIQGFTPDTYKEFVNSIVFQSKVITKLMGLEKDCLYATLNIIVHYNNKTYALMIGDGCLMYKTTDGIIDFISHEYKNNYPFYPIYISENINTEDKGLIVKTMTETTEHPYATVKLYEFDNIEWILGSSDGIFSFTNGYELIDFEDIRTQLSDLKSFKGEFIERKMKRIIKNFNKDGNYNSDDWSVTGLYLGE